MGGGASKTSGPRQEIATHTVRSVKPISYSLGTDNNDIDNNKGQKSTVSLNYKTEKDDSGIDGVDGLPNASFQGNGPKPSTDGNDSGTKEHEEQKKRDNTGSRTVVETDDGTLISLPQQSAEGLEHDKQTPRQQFEDRNSKKERQTEASESVRVRKQDLETSLQRLKNKYHDSDILTSSVQEAVTMIDNKKLKQNSPVEKPYSLDYTKYEEARIKIATLQQEKAKLLHRLSELASARLRHNNPDIADLSDQNRATKLAEKLSELYDNEWTDTFEATKKRKGGTDDKVIAKSLRNILKICYESCQKIAYKQQSNFFSSLHLDVKTDLQTCPPDLRLRLKEFQKNISQYSLPRVKEVIKRDAIKQQKETNIVVGTLHLVKKQNPFNSFINLCTEITWYIQIQDPPLVLDFNESTSIAARFRPYTVTGPQLDYILWPAMLLHEGGPLVAKGVAQFRKTCDSSEQISEKGNDTNKKKHNEQENTPITGKSEW